MASLTQISTGKTRFSYVSIFTPKPNKSGALKYSVTLLIPKTDKATLDKMKTAIEAAKAAYIAKGGKALPKQLKTILHDGDGERPNGGDFGPECKGCIVLTVSSNNQPVIVDELKQTIIDQRDVYSGCYGRAIINFYVYNTEGSVGISAGLNGIMKLADGEPLAGGVVTDSDWDEGFEDADDLLS